MTETSYSFNMTPEMARRLRAFAEERGWSVVETVRYFIEDGLDGEARRAELASQAASQTAMDAERRAPMQALMKAVLAKDEERKRQH